MLRKLALNALKQHTSAHRGEAKGDMYFENPIETVHYNLLIIKAMVI